MSVQNFSFQELIFTILLLILVSAVGSWYKWHKGFTALLGVFVAAGFILVAWSTGPVK